MIIEVQLTIDKPKEAIWARITNFENAAETIESIQKIEILERPANGLIGLKWRETRTLFGKTATEVMWITDASENEFYQTRAESHGFVYLNTVNISEQGDASVLSMEHVSKPQSFMAKLMSLPMGLMFKGVFKKAMLQDLKDIKIKIEQL
jgi:polyketide cyclase/dehydrase/lipid transport protein